jgi:glycosidase
VSRFARAISAAAAIAVLSLTASTGAARSPLTALARAPAVSSLASDRIYFVMPDRYADGDPSNDTGGLTGTRNVTGFDPTSPAYWHGGDLKGLTGTCTDPVHGLARIRDLGFDAIWVTPVVVNQISQGDSAGYHGYWGMDFTRVDPHLGTDADFAAFVSCAHGLGMKVIMDVVVNHTGDVIQTAGGGTYSAAPYRDCHGRVFDPARYVGGRAFPCLSPRFMPEQPYVAPALAHAKTPAWLNDVTNYHDRGDVDFSSCSEQCYEQGDVFGLDDLFTEKPEVVQGLVRIYADWITRYRLDGFRVDTARHVNAGFWPLWIPKMLAAARSVGIRDFQIFGEVPITDAIELSSYVRDRGLPSVLDFPFQDAAASYAAGGSSALALRNRMQDDDYFRLPDGLDPTPPTFLGNHDQGRAAFQIAQAGGGLTGDALLRRTLLGYDLLYLLRGALVVYYGDEVGMIGTGGDQHARQDMFPTQVPDWRTQPRIGSPPIGTGSSFDVTANPIEAELRTLGRLRDGVPALSSGASVVRLARGPLLAVSRVDAAARKEVLAVFNAGGAPFAATVQTATPSTTWTALLGPVGGTSDASGRVSVTVPPLSALLLEPAASLPRRPLPAPRLTAGPDALSPLFALTASVPTLDPVAVTFAVRRAGGAWRRVDVDDSPPYRGFLEPSRFRRKERVQVVAVVRSSSGAVAASPIVTAIPRP